MVTDAQARPVKADDGVLRCGRTLADVIALVVRAAARRYFRTRLGVRRTRPVAQPRTGLWRRMGVVLGLAAPPKPVRPVPQADLPAERLYRAIRDYLRFDWQASLIPHYAPMTPQLVTQLGSRLLDFREPAELASLAGHAEEHVAGGHTPLLLDTAQRLITKGRETSIPDPWCICLQMDLARLFPSREVTEMRRAVAMVATTLPSAISALMPVLGGDIRRFTAFLMVAYVTMGEQRYRQTFGTSGHSVEVRRYGERLARLVPPPPCLDEMKHAYQDVLNANASGPSAADLAAARAEVMAAMARLPSRTMRPGAGKL